LDAHIGKILALDKEYTQRSKVPPLFSYFLARPKKSVLSDQTKLDYCQKIEDLREEKARKRYGVYSNDQYLLMILHSFWRRLVRGGKDLVKVPLKKLLMR
jgi:hypothetical protein